MIAESFGVRLAPSRRTAFALRRVEATAVSASPEGLTTVTDALVAKARKLSPGLEGVNNRTSYPRMRHTLGTSGDMRARWLVNDDDDGLDGNTDAGVGTD
jgi:hypothetical protein